MAKRKGDGRDMLDLSQGHSMFHSLTKQKSSEHGKTGMADLHVSQEHSMLQFDSLTR